MTDIGKERASYAERWVDKLWQALFAGDDGCLMSPGQIRREHRDRSKVRKREMQALMAAESELNAIRKGLKTLDALGNLIDTPEVGDYTTHRIIENKQVEDLHDVGHGTVQTMLDSAAKASRIRELERSLNIMKMALLADAEIHRSQPCAVSPKPPAAEWLIRWRQGAQDVFNPELQEVYVLALIKEVAKPGALSIAALTTLGRFGADDLDMLRMIAKYRIGDLVYSAAGGYFDTEFHRGMFEVMDDLGLLNGVGQEPVTRLLPSDKPGSYHHLLCCGSKALAIRHSDPAFKCRIPVYSLKRQCKQLCELVTPESDVAYLYDLANFLKSQGASVVLGEWHEEGAGGHFVERMPL